MFKDIFEEADWILAQIREFKKRASEIEQEATEEMNRVKAKYETELNILQDSIKGMEKRLKDLCRKEKAFLFEQTDRVDLKHGALLYHAQWRVKRARGVLKRLKELGLTDAIKVVESVRWDVLEKWSDEKLFVCGTEKVLKEDFSYELYQEKEIQQVCNSKRQAQ